MANKAGSASRKDAVARKTDHRESITRKKRIAIKHNIVNFLGSEWEAYMETIREMREKDPKLYLTTMDKLIEKGVGKAPIEQTTEHNHKHQIEWNEQKTYVDGDKAGKVIDITPTDIADENGKEQRSDSA
jgi:hypothetical protein